MKLAVISDLHLAPEPTNRCTADPGQLDALCDQLEAGADQVMVAGDLVDLDRPRLPGGWRRQWRAVRAEFSALFERLDAYDWVFGNHDGQLCRLGVPEERALVADGLEVLVWHGHQWDMPAKKMPGLAAAANFMAGWFNRAGLEPLAGAMAAVPKWADRIASSTAADPTADGPDRCLRGARSLLETTNWDIVVSGHSHQLRLEATDAGLFVNTGSVCRGWCDWVVVDTAAGRVQTLRDGRLRHQADLVASDGPGPGRWQVTGG